MYHPSLAITLNIRQVTLNSTEIIPASLRSLSSSSAPITSSESTARSRRKDQPSSLEIIQGTVPSINTLMRKIVRRAREKTTSSIKTVREGRETRSGTRRKE